MYYKILPFDNNSDRIMIPKHLANKNFIYNGSEIILQAGMKNKIAQVTLTSNRINYKTIKLSQNIIDYLSLPTGLNYQVITKGNILKIGPVIGLLFTRSDRQIDEEGLGKCLDYTIHYEKFHGLLCLFSLRGIDFGERTVRGYYYQPSENNNGGHWEAGSFPLPGAIYRRLVLDSSEKSTLNLATGNRMFNSSYFDKWELWSTISSSDRLRRYLPDTCKLTSFEDVKEMLQKYGKVYLKLRNGSLCQGLIEVTKDKNYCFKSSESRKPIIFENEESASLYIEQLKENRNYLVQQSISSLRLENRVVDFRVVMQKDENFTWNCTAIIGKAGRVNDICSYHGEYGWTMTFASALTKTCGLPAKDILLKTDELIKVCTMLCRELDCTGENFGDFAIDVALDNDLNIWILEANNQQDFRILRRAYGNKYCRSVRSNVTRYAVALTGFRVTEKK